MRRLRIGAAIIILMVLVSVFSASAGTIDMDNRLSRPSLAYPFGCDSFGRSLFPRLSYGFLVSLSVGASSAMISVALSAALSFAIIKAGRLRPVLYAVLDGMKVIPSIVLALFLASISGPGIRNIIYVLVFSFVPSATRTFCSVMDRIYRLPFIEAAYAEGAGEMRVFFRHVLPHSSYYLREEAVSLALSAILIESSLSFIGAGVSVSTPSIGLILQEARPFLLTYPHMALFPSAVLIVLASSLLMISRGLRELDSPSE